MLASVGIVTAILLSLPGTEPRRDSADVANVLAQFYSALTAGDSATALSLLAPDALILESGDLETRAEYRAHHLKDDIDFARAVRSQRKVLRVTVSGSAAWIIATSSTEGRFQGRPISMVGAELLVLRKTGAGWQIAAVHWSSHRRRTT